MDTTDKGSLDQTTLEKGHLAILLEILPGDATEEKSPSSQAQVSHSIGVGPSSEAEAADISSPEPARQLPRKRRAPSPDSTTVSKRCSDGNKKSTKTWPNGDSYEGELLNGEPDGYGAMHYADGRTYIGDWMVGMKEGRGVFTWHSSERYEGEYKNDNRHGHGVLTYQEGSHIEVYTGSWKDDTVHGYGVFTLSEL
jgi:hypothetical protein